MCRRVGLSSFCYFPAVPVLLHHLGQWNLHVTEKQTSRSHMMIFVVQSNAALWWGIQFSQSLFVKGHFQTFSCGSGVWRILVAHAQRVFSEEFNSMGKLSASNTACFVYYNISYSQLIYTSSAIPHLCGLSLSLGWDRGTVCSEYLYTLFHPVLGHHTPGSGYNNMRLIKNTWYH